MVVWRCYLRGSVLASTADPASTHTESLFLQLVEESLRYVLAKWRCLLPCPAPSQVRSRTRLCRDARTCRNVGMVADGVAPRSSGALSYSGYFIAGGTSDFEPRRKCCRTTT